LTGTPGEYEFRRETHPALHPAQSARVYRGPQAIGWFGTLHPEVVAQLDLTYPAIVFELEASATLRAQLPQFSEISRYPAIRRDLALIVDESIELARIKALVSQHAGELLQALSVFDVYRGAGIEKGKKSIALGFTLQDTSRTLTDEDADAIMNRVADRLRSELDAIIRDK
jgi:phenylalanyl-tRNA synthetase beta chain